MLFFLGLGVLARSVRYLLRFPLWKDEAFLAVNYIDATYADLAGALHPHQVVPIFYLFGQLTLTKLFGFNEYSLRAVSYVAGIGALFLFLYIASRFLRGASLLLAVAFFSVSYPLIRYSIEAKPYSLDVFVTTVLLALLVRWLDNLDRTSSLWTIAAIAPIAIGSSFPSLIVLAALSIVIAVVILNGQLYRAWLPWVGINASSLASFAATFTLVIRSPNAGELAWMREELVWQRAFPPLDSLVDLLTWIVEVHAGDMLSYPAGRGSISGIYMLACCLAGGWTLWRARRRGLLLMCCAPIVVNLVAAALRRYPYGGEVRVALYLAPFFCLLGGVGCAAIIRWMRRNRLRVAKPGLAPALILAAVGLASIGKDLVQPYRNPADDQTRAFARSFWPRAQQEGEVVCLDTDLGLTFSHETTREFVDTHGAAELSNVSALYTYRCHQRIYSPRHAAGDPPRWDAVSAGRPLRFVRFATDEIDYDEIAYGRWIERLRDRCESLDHERHTFPMDEIDEDKPGGVDSFEIWTCVPKGAVDRSSFSLTP